MKKLIQSLSIIGTVGLTMAILLGNRPANALTFAFSQSGWDGEAEVIGTFSGEDTNGNGIRSDENEVSAYEMNFLAGNSTFNNFTHNFADLDNLIYDFLSNTVTIFSTSSSSYISQGFLGLGFIGQDGDSITTNEPVNVTIKEVPEQRSWKALVLFGVGAYFTRKIRTKFIE